MIVLEFRRKQQSILITYHSGRDLRWNKQLDFILHIQRSYLCI